MAIVGSSDAAGELTANPAGQNEPTAEEAPVAPVTTVEPVTPEESGFLLRLPICQYERREGEPGDDLAPPGYENILNLLSLVLNTQNRDMLINAWFISIYIVTTVHFPAEIRRRAHIIIEKNSQ